MNYTGDPSCSTCKYCSFHLPSIPGECGHKLSNFASHNMKVINDGRLLTTTMRQPGAKCGPEGNLWEPALWHTWRRRMEFVWSRMIKVLRDIGYILPRI